MADNRDGRDPFDDKPTEFIGRDDATRRVGGAGYDPDADFGGGDATRFDGGGDATRYGPGTGAAGAAGDGSGQYWAPLTPEERGSAGGPPPGPPGGPPRDGGYGRGDYDGAGDGDRDRDSRGSGNRGGFIVAIVAIIAVVILVALMFRFLSGGDEDPTTTQTPPPEPETTAETTSEPTQTTDDRLQNEIDRLRDEVSSIRETPPAIPGLGGGEVVEATIPEAEGKSPAEVELSLRRAGFGDITVLDANGNPTNSISSLTGTVDSIEPPAGTVTTTDQPVTIRLR